MSSTIKPLPLFARVFLPVLITVLVFGCSKSGIVVQIPAEKVTKNECVILLHGLARSLNSMSSLQDKLVLNGYYTVNLGYPSTEKTIEAIAAEHLPEALEACQQFNPERIHFVTHSLGGIVLRQALKDSRPDNLGRVVMYSPPNKGSKITDKLQDWWIYSWVNGPAGQQLSTHLDSLPNRLGPVDYPVGIITGDRFAFFDAWFSTILPGKDDGKVSVERAKLDGMSDFLVVHESHPFIMNADYVHEETLYFLAHGVFKHQKNPPPPVSGTDWFSFKSH